MKTNDLWKLDLLEAKFTNSSPRLPYTKKLLTAKNNSKLLKKLPLNKDEALVQIEELKLDLFAKKYYNINSKLGKEIRRLSSGELKNFIAADAKNLDNLIASRVTKCIISSILPRKDQKENPPSYLGSEVILIITNKENPANSSRFFKDNCQNDKALNKSISNLWNNKTIRSLLMDAEWSFQVVRGNITKEEREKRQKDTGKRVEIEEAGDNESVDSEDDESVDIKDAKVFDESNYAVYENGTALGEDEQFEIDSNVNYNEVTDEEPSASEEEEEESDSEEFLESTSSKSASKVVSNLPQLATGYFSGGESDSEIEEDEVVKNATLQRKNRRGQRARQKIWEQKYGKSAKHLEKERVKFQSERDQRQREYEERVRRRAEKARLAEETAPSGSNVEPLGERKSRKASESGVPESKSEGKLQLKSEAVHPSWQAKKLAEEKQKNAKFQGKKITFD